jgi:hypothetical protein
MQVLPTLLAGIGGLFATFMALSFIVRWLRLFLTAVGVLPGQRAATATQRVPSILLATVLHPVPWLLLVGLPLALLHLPGRIPGAGLSAFLGGAGLGISLYGAILVVALRRMRKIQAARTRQVNDVV